jgi:uncharacterized protein
MTENVSPQRERIGITTFIVVLFAVSWIGAAPMVLASWDKIEPNTFYKVLQVVMMLFGAALVAICASAMNGGKAGVKELLRGLLRWRAGWQWWIGVLVGQALVAAAAIWIGAAITGSVPKFRSAEDTLAVFVSAFIPYFFLNTEELAWRGYLLPRMQARMGAVKATAIIGVLWGVFHIPIFMMKGGHPAGFKLLPYLVMTFLLAFIFTTVYNRTSGSILLVHLLHQSVNSWSEAIPFFPRATGNDAGMYVNLMIAAVLVGTFVSTGLIHRSRDRRG